jgi:hypothetical protein
MCGYVACVLECFGSVCCATNQTNQRSNWGVELREAQVDALSLLAIPTLFTLLAR